MEADASFVAAGVDTHKDVHVLCVIDALGRKVREGAFPATAAGYRDLADAIGAPGKCLVVGIEETCSFGAGLTARLAGSGFNVVEVLRPKRDKRRKGASKNDFVDAERAARMAIAGDGTSIPKSRDGWAEAARPALRAREILVRTQMQVANAVKALLNTVPEPVRGNYAKLSGKKLMNALRRRKPATGDAIRDSLMLSLSTLAATWIDAESKASELEAFVEAIVRENAPAVLEIDGCGALSAAELGLVAGDNPGRMRSEASFAVLCGASPIEASSGKTVRHSLNRDGNRRANRALHSIVISRMRSDARTSEYIAKCVPEGKSKREAMRWLKRYVAREAYRALMSPTATRHAAGPSLAARRKRAGLLRRGVAAREGIGPSVISSIETERAKHAAARDAYEAFLDGAEKLNNAG